jgi:hypothetical protein
VPGSLTSRASPPCAPHDERSDRMALGGWAGLKIPLTLSDLKALREEWAEGFAPQGVVLEPSRLPLNTGMNRPPWCREPRG